MKSHFRTDLAIEEIGRIGDHEILGVKSSIEEHNHVKVEKTIIDEIHDERISKKPGTYYTIDLRSLNYHDHTISDNIITGEETTSQERQTAFTDMMEVALETAIIQ